MRLLYNDTTYVNYCEEYVKVVEKHYVYEKNFHNKFLSEAENEFSLAMHTEYEFLIHNKVHNYKLEPELRSELKTTGLNVMKSLKHHIGFDVGLLELMFAPKGSELEKLLTNEDKCCCCPLHKRAQDLNKMNKHFVYNTCSEFRPLPKMDLIRHLHDKAHHNGDIYHYVALIYVKNVYG